MRLLGVTHGSAGSFLRSFPWSKPLAAPEVRNCGKRYGWRTGVDAFLNDSGLEEPPTVTVERIMATTATPQYLYLLDEDLYRLGQRDDFKVE